MTAVLRTSRRLSLDRCREVECPLTLAALPAAAAAARLGEAPSSSPARPKSLNGHSELCRRSGPESPLASAPAMLRRTLPCHAMSCRAVPFRGPCRPIVPRRGKPSPLRPSVAWASPDPISLPSTPGHHLLLLLRTPFLSRLSTCLGASPGGKRRPWAPRGREARGGIRIMDGMALLPEMRRFCFENCRL
jgi:hypothetical protein